MLMSRCRVVEIPSLIADMVCALKALLLSRTGTVPHAIGFLVLLGCPAIFLSFDTRGGGGGAFGVFHFSEWRVVQVNVCFLFFEDNTSTIQFTSDKSEFSVKI